MPPLLFRTRRLWYFLHHSCTIKLRHYATNKEYSSILNQQRTRAAFQNSRSVGPFMLGNVQSFGGERVETWNELSPGGKIVRTTARTTNLLVIFLGASLSVLLVYALATELYAENSPTVLYGDACEMIKNSEELRRYLKGNLRFYNNPPIEGRPQYRRRGVAHHTFVDSRGAEHMYINFFVDTSKAEETHFWETPLSERFGTWYNGVVRSARDLSLEGARRSAKQRLDETSEILVNTFRRLTNQRVEQTSRDSVPIKRVEEPTQMQKHNGWNTGAIFGMLNGLRRKSAQTLVKQETTFWDQAEVHADLVRSSDGNYRWRYLIVDIPSSRHPSPHRVFIQRAPDVRNNESVMLWQ